MITNIPRDRCTCESIQELDSAGSLVVAGFCLLVCLVWFGVLGVLGDCAAGASGKCNTLDNSAI